MSTSETTATIIVATVVISVWSNYHLFADEVCCCCKASFGYSCYHCCSWCSHVVAEIPAGHRLSVSEQQIPALKQIVSVEQFRLSLL